MNIAFVSKYASRIWDRLYMVDIPDIITRNAKYISVRGVRSTGYSDIDKILKDRYTTVMIPIIKILEYYDSGVDVRVHSRSDMLDMHRDITLYLDEWRENIQESINTSVHLHSKLILSLDKLAKYMYAKATPKEIAKDNIIESKPNILGMHTIVYEQEQSKIPRIYDKPEFNSISRLVRNKIKPS